MKLAKTLFFELESTFARFANMIELYQPIAWLRRSSKIHFFFLSLISSHLVSSRPASLCVDVVYLLLPSEEDNLAKKEDLIS